MPAASLKEASREARNKKIAFAEKFFGFPVPAKTNLEIIRSWDKLNDRSLPTDV